MMPADDRYRGLDRENDRWRERMENRVDKLEDTVTSLTKKLDANTDLTQTISKDVKDLVTLMSGGKAIGKLLTWSAGVSIACGTLWNLVKDHLTK